MVLKTGAQHQVRAVTVQPVSRLKALGLGRVRMIAGGLTCCMDGHGYPLLVQVGNGPFGHRLLSADVV